MAKYTKEEKQKTIDLYINYCKRTTRGIKELGYPNKRHTLVSWYSEYEKNGKVRMMDERKRSSPWNMDLKKLTDYRARIAQAKPDVNRKESYILGNSR